MNRGKLIAMSHSFVSYLFREHDLDNKIHNIFLFGSVARNDFDESSDVDIFIDIEKKDEKQTEKIAQRALKKFYQIEGEKWLFKGIKNNISLKIGSLEEWELKSSIENEGIVLFSLSPTAKLKKYLLFYIKPIKSPKKRVKIIRTLFGRNEKNYKTKGLVHEFEGKTINTRVFLVPSHRMKDIASFLSKEKVNFGFEEVWQ